MPSARPLRLLAAAVRLSACSTLPASGPMGFFITSTNPGKGADFGGLVGADAHGQRLAAAAGAGHRTWRASFAEGGAMTGHHDRIGRVAEPWAQAWNSAHASRGCGLPQLRTTGGAGLLYCFAAD